MFEVSRIYLAILKFNAAPTPSGPRESDQLLPAIELNSDEPKPGSPALGPIPLSMTVSEISVALEFRTIVASVAKP
jgi:hypothetical protein